MRAEWQHRIRIGEKQSCPSSHGDQFLLFSFTFSKCKPRWRSWMIHAAGSFTLLAGGSQCGPTLTWWLKVRLWTILRVFAFYPTVALFERCSNLLFIPTSLDLSGLHGRF